MSGRYNPWDGLEVGVNDDGSLDEIVAFKPDIFHLEQITKNCWWASINTGSHDLHFNIWTPRARLRANYYSNDEGAFWEGGEYSSGLILPPWFEGGTT